MSAKNESLSMNPLKQGLKPQVSPGKPVYGRVFIHESIKTRVETYITIAKSYSCAGLYP